MTDYNDGKWRGFSGGKIPVHPHTEVECFFSDGVKNSGLAKEYSWETDPEWIAFRVIKPYREPRVLWMKPHSMIDGCLVECNPGHPQAILFREVLAD